MSRRLISAFWVLLGAAVIYIGLHEILDPVFAALPLVSGSTGSQKTLGTWLSWTFVALGISCVVVPILELRGAVTYDYKALGARAKARQDVIICSLLLPVALFLYLSLQEMADNPRISWSAAKLLGMLFFAHFAWAIYRAIRVK